MHLRCLLPCLTVAAVGLGGCGGGSSSAAVAQSSAVKASALAAVAAGNNSPAVTTKGVSQSSSSRSSAAVKPTALALVDAQGNPIIPAAARAHTDAGAIAFTKYYVALLDYLDQHPDPSIGRSVDDENCPACDKMNALLKEHQQKGIHFVGNHTSLASFKLQSLPDRSQVIVSFRQSKTPCKRIDGSGKVVSLGAPKFDTRLLLLWEKNGWKVGDMGSDPV